MRRREARRPVVVVVMDYKLIDWCELSLSGPHMPSTGVNGLGSAGSMQPSDWP